MFTTELFNIFLNHMYSIRHLYKLHTHTRIYCTRNFMRVIWKRIISRRVGVNAVDYLCRLPSQRTKSQSCMLLLGKSTMRVSFKWSNVLSCFVLLHLYLQAVWIRENRRIRYLSGKLIATLYEIKPNKKTRKQENIFSFLSVQPQTLQKHFGFPFRASTKLIFLYYLETKQVNNFSKYIYIYIQKASPKIHNNHNHKIDLIVRARHIKSAFFSCLYHNEIKPNYSKALSLKPNFYKLWRLLCWNMQREKIPDLSQVDTSHYQLHKIQPITEHHVLLLGFAITIQKLTEICQVSCKNQSRISARVSDDSSSLTRVSDDLSNLARVSDKSSSLARVSDDSSSPARVSDDTSGPISL